VLQRCSDLINFLNDAVERVCRSIVEEQGVRTAWVFRTTSRQPSWTGRERQLSAAVFCVCNLFCGGGGGGHGQVLGHKTRVPPLSTPINYWQPPTQGLFHK
jgi:hypothetical protein